jgi:hypothetical protein
MGEATVTRSKLCLTKSPHCSKVTILGIYSQEQPSHMTPGIRSKILL